MTGQLAILGDFDRRPIVIPPLGQILIYIQEVTGAEAGGAILDAELQSGVPPVPQKSETVGEETPTLLCRRRFTLFRR